MLFSIITVCFNNLEELKRTFNSTNAQTCRDFEWIVIDGGSSDGTKDWLQQNTLTDKWISEPDNGIYDAMNKGIGKAVGKYLIFMNSGDEFAAPDVLDRIKPLISERQNKPALLYGDAIDADEKDKHYYRKAKKYSSIKYGMITQHQAMFFRNDAVPGVHYSDELKLSADYALISGIIKNNDPEDIVQLDFPVCTFRMGGLNESKRFRALKEDYTIRHRVLRLPWIESTVLYVLHYVHAVIKHLFKRSRFLRHRSVPG